jgi:hypothetical protein
MRNSTDGKFAASRASYFVKALGDSEGSFFVAIVSDYGLLTKFSRRFNAMQNVSIMRTNAARGQLRPL